MSEFTPLSTGALAVSCGKLFDFIIRCKFFVFSPQRIIKGDDFESPVFQVLSTSRVRPSHEGAPPRIRLHISDGLMKHTFAMFNIEQSNYQQDDFSEYTIIRVPRYSCSIINRNDANER